MSRNISQSQNSQNNKQKFICEKCDYFTFRKHDLEKHFLTAKHKIAREAIVEVAKVAEVAKISETRLYVCKKCDRNFKSNSGLWRHSKTCNYEPKCEEINNNSGISEELVTKLINENTEIKNLMINVVSTNNELTKKVIELAPQQIGTQNNTINNNQRFNINVFLNEKCKDAMNMSDFIKSIEVSLQQLDLTKTHGLEQGITNVIMENMSNLSVYERPIHCTDTKRETLYIKDGDKWEKDKDRTKIKHVIKKASGKNYDALVKWTKENPDFMESDDKQRYYALALSKLGKPLDGVDDKVIKKICNHTYVKDDLNDEI